MKINNIKEPHLRQPLRESGTFMAKSILQRLTTIGFAAILIVSLSVSHAYTQETSRTNSVYYIDQLIKKINPSLKKFVKKDGFNEHVALVGIIAQGTDFSVNEKSYLISQLERKQYKDSRFHIITSVEAFNKTKQVNDAFVLDFATTEEDAITHAQSLDLDYYMVISLTFKRKTVNMQMGIYAVENNQRVWFDSISIFYEAETFNYSFGLTQTLGYEFAFYLTTVVSSYLTSYLNFGILFGLGFAFSDQSYEPTTINRLKYLFGMKFAISLIRPFRKKYNGFDLTLNSVIGAESGSLFSSAVRTNTRGGLIGTVGLGMFINGRVSINFAWDIAKVIGGSSSGLSFGDSILGYVEIAYHF